MNVVIEKYKVAFNENADVQVPKLFLSGIFE